MTNLREKLARELCDAEQPRVFAEQTEAPSFDDSYLHVQVYWRLIADAVLSTLTAEGMVPEWQPIETAPIPAFDVERWWAEAFRALVWTGAYVTIASYSYTKHGKGRWRNLISNIEPTYWMPLPDAPALEGNRE